MTDLEKDTRVKQLYEFLNMTGRSNFVDTRPVLTEIARLLDLPKGSIKQDGY